MPVGVLIESGQADLLLVSYLGADFVNKGERVYRLLGCEVTFRAELPQVGETLQYEIHLDGYAQHTVGQQQRRHGHTHLAHKVILLRKDRPQHLGNLARRHVFELPAIQRRAGIAVAMLAYGRGARGEGRGGGSRNCGL